MEDAVRQAFVTPGPGWVTVREKRRPTQGRGMSVHMRQEQATHFVDTHVLIHTIHF